MDASVGHLVEQVRSAVASRTALRVRGGGSKDFYGNEPKGELLDVRSLQGIVAYDPSELVVTARAGMPLLEFEQTLASRGQMLAFEPPHFSERATVGGCIASGLAGPRRASAGTSYGGVRDFLLGARLLDGNARVLSFGGTVMKNVAGYDVARLLAGSLGILGVILDVSLKVLPLPAAQVTLRFEMDEAMALECLNLWSGQPLPLSASMWCGGMLAVRLAGAQAALTAAQKRLGGERVEAAAADVFWRGVRDHTHEFFAASIPLWRVSVPSTAPPLELESEQLIEWGGSLRWIRSERLPHVIRDRAAQVRGHATCFRGGNRSETFTPLTPALLNVHRALKSTFDPAGIFNPGRMYADL